MQNFPGFLVLAAAPVSLSATTSRPVFADAREGLFRAITALDHEVAAWLATPAAWDQRAHPSIRQFLVDIREYAAALERGGKVSPNIIVAAADRLAGKVHHAAVDQSVVAMRAALDAYVRALHG